MTRAPVQLVDEHFRLAFEAAPTGMLLIDEQGRILLANDYVLRLFDFTRDELVGQGVERLVPERFSDHAEIRRRFWAAPSSRMMGQGRDLFGRRKDGSEVPVEVGLNPMPTRDGVLILCSVIDITERLKTAGELRGALAAKETLLREVHHRVKNNLQVISSLLNLQAANAGEPAARVLRETQNRVHSIALVHDLLQLSTEQARVDLTEYLGALTSHLASSWGPGVRVSLDVRGNVSLPLEAAVPCGLIVNELVTNSLKHAFPSGRGSVTVSVVREAEHVELVVRDDGIGIPQPPPSSGLGLGLELLGTLSRQLKGSFELVSQGGTTATVRFSSS